MKKRNKNLRERVFGITNMLSLITLVLLLLAGSIVRSTGAGMGCPDWPKCFGEIIPPTSEDQLPDNYLSVFQEQRMEKNERLAVMLGKLGYHSLASRIVNDPKIKEEEPFNAVKTWTEYINRLIGAVMGVFVLINFIAAFGFIKTRRSIFFVSSLILVILLFQAWMGSVVVSTNLLSGTISLHMLLAVVLGVLIIRNIVYTRPVDMISRDSIMKIQPSLYIFTILALIQLMLGVNVRESVDHLLDEYSRSQVISLLPAGFTLHKAFSILVVAGAGLLYLNTRKYVKSTGFTKWVNVLTVIIAFEVIAGITLQCFNLPTFVQPLHLMLGVSVVLVSGYLVMTVLKNKRYSEI